MKKSRIKIYYGKDSTEYLLFDMDDWLSYRYRQGDILYKLYLVQALQGTEDDVITERTIDHFARKNHYEKAFELYTQDGLTLCDNFNIVPVEQFKTDAKHMMAFTDRYLCEGDKDTIALYSKINTILTML